MKEMKTPEEILIEFSPTPDAGYKYSWLTIAMKAYAKQWVEKAIKETVDAPETLIEMYHKEIDAQ